MTNEQISEMLATIVTAFMQKGAEKDALVKRENDEIFWWQTYNLTLNGLLSKYGLEGLSNGVSLTEQAATIAERVHGFIPGSYFGDGAKHTEETSPIVTDPPAE